MNSCALRRLVLGALIVLSAFPLLLRAGFGVSPGLILEEHAVPGSTFTRTIYLVQGVPDKPATIRVEVESRDMGDWITLPSGTDFTIPAGVQQFPLAVTIGVPAGTDLGVYRAFIRITTAPDAATESGEVAIALGGRVDVSVTVGDDVIEAFTVKNLDILSIVEGENPQTAMTIENTGNSPALPDSLSFELFDKFGNIRLGFASASLETFERTPAFSEQTYRVEFPMDIVLAPGEYWGHVRVHARDGSTIRELRTPFNVTAQQGLVLGVSDFFKGQSSLMRAGIIFVGIAIILFILLLLIRRARAPRVYE